MSQSRRLQCHIRRREPSAISTVTTAANGQERQSDGSRRFTVWGLVSSFDIAYYLSFLPHGLPRSNYKPSSPALCPIITRKTVLAICPESGGFAGKKARHRPALLRWPHLNLGLGAIPICLLAGTLFSGRATPDHFSAKLGTVRRRAWTRAARQKPSRRYRRTQARLPPPERHDGKRGGQRAVAPVLLRRPLTTALCSEYQVMGTGSDDGPGFPADLDPDQSGSTGLHLITSLVGWDLSG